MDSSGVQIQLDPVAPPETPKSRDVAPGRKRDDQDETRDAAAAAILTASFAEILQSKRLDLKIDVEEKAKKRYRSQGRRGSARAGERAARCRQEASQAALCRSAGQRDAGEREGTGRCGHEGRHGKRDQRGWPGSVQSADLTKKGALSPAEEALLKEMIQKNGNLAAQKKAAQVTGFVNGEPLNRREGIGAVKSMTAQEGEVLKNLSGGDDAQTSAKTQKGKTGEGPAGIYPA